MSATHQVPLRHIMLAHLEQLALSLPTLKVAIGLLYLHDDQVGWHRTTYEDDKAGWIRTATLKSLVGYGASNDNRIIARAISELRRADLFDTISVDGRLLTWKASRTAFALMEDVTGRYSLVDFDALRKLRNPVEFIAYSRVQMVKKMKAPMFELPVGTWDNFRWTDFRAKLFAVLEQIGRTGKMTFFVALQEGVAPGEPRRLLVRIGKEDATWYNGAFRKRPIGSLAWELDPKASRVTSFGRL